MSGPYDVIMCDPPWPISLTGKRTSARAGVLPSLPYRTAPDVGALLRTDVLPLAAPRHVLFLWATEGTLRQAEGLLETAGYRLHLRIIWDKSEGYAPAFTLRWTHEYLLWAYVPPLLPVAPGAGGKYASVLRAERREHSRKPEAAYRLVEALYPDARRLDAFTREYRPGWDGMGDQRDHFTPLLAPLREEATP